MTFALLLPLFFFLRDLPLGALAALEALPAALEASLAALEASLAALEASLAAMLEDAPSWFSWTSSWFAAAYLLFGHELLDRCQQWRSNIHVRSKPWRCLHCWDITAKPQHETSHGHVSHPPLIFSTCFGLVAAGLVH